MSSEAVAQGHPQKSGGVFPTFAELLGFQDGTDEPLGEGVDLVDVDPEIFAELNEDILTQSEIGAERPGQLTLRPDRAFKIGNVRIYPLLRQSLIFDDNIFLTDTVNQERQAGNPTPHRGTRESDYISRTEAGFLTRVEFGDGDHQFNFGGKITHDEYLRRTLHFREEYAGGTLYLVFNRFRLQIGDRWEHRYDPIEIEFTDKLERTINTAHALAAFEADEVGLEVGYNREDTRFIDFEIGSPTGVGSVPVRSLDRAETTVEVRPMVRVSEDVWAFFEYAYLFRQMDEDALPDSMGNRYSVGVKGNVNERFQLWARVGWLREDFETDAFSLDPNGMVVPFVDPGDSRNGDIQASINAIYDLEDLTRLEVSYIRLSQFSSSSNYQMLDRGDITILRQFYPNVLGRFGAAYEYARPSNSKNASRVEAGVGIQYLVTSWVSLDADYAYRRRNASAKGGDYTNHVGSVGATIRF